MYEKHKDQLSFLHTDDTVILSDSSEGLQTALNLYIVYTNIQISGILDFVG